MSDTVDADIRRIIESAERLGVKLDEADTVHWLSAIAAQSDDDVTVDTVIGVSGRARSDGSIDAAVVTTGRGLRDGDGPFGHGGPGFGRGPWGGEQGE